MTRAAFIFRLIVWNLLGILIGSLVIAALVTSVASCSHALTSPAMGVSNPPAGVRMTPVFLVFPQASDPAAGRRSNFSPAHAA